MPETLAPADDSTAHPSEAPSIDILSLRRRKDAMRRDALRMLGRPRSAGMELAARHARAADALLIELHRAVTAASDHPPHLLGAVGGYGRQLLGLESDLDLCIVTRTPPESMSSLIDGLMYPLWDAGISVGHQVVCLADAAHDARDELALATELLDFRPLRGDLTLGERLREQLHATVFAHGQVEGFIEQLQRQAAERHRQFGDSVYLLEPEVKSGTGGLRDLDFALWAARARLGTGDLSHLASRGVLTEQQHQGTHAAMDFLWAVRNHLHHAARRKSDRLTFEQQEAVAHAMGYARVASEEMSEVQRVGVMVETFMSDYYRHARVIAQTRDRILGQARRRPRASRPPTRDVGDGLVTCEGRLGLENPNAVMDDPPLALRLYHTAIQRDLGVLSRTRDAIARATESEDFCARLRASREASNLFVRLLCARETTELTAGTVMQELHDVGLLLAMIPEFAPVVGRVHHDLYHVYTVDAHSVAAIDRLRALTRGEVAAGHPLACRLAAELTRPHVLFLATLLHDVGKDIGGKDHAARGAIVARTILERLGLSEDESEDVCRLIREHLTMYLVAMRRDIHDPAAIEDFARTVGSREGLRDLYLLTVADLSTTSSVSMTEWKANMLVSLFRATDAHLSGKEDGLSRRARRVRAEVRSLWPEARDVAALEAFLDSMPDRYFLSTTPVEILEHARLATVPQDDGIGCAMLPSESEGMMGLCVVTRPSRKVGVYVVAGDRPGLLASIAAAISANGLAIRAAQIASRALPEGDQQAVDVFWVRGDVEQEGYAERVEKLKRDLGRIVDGQVSADDLVKPPRRPSWSERPPPPIATEVYFDHFASTDHTIVEVLSEDRFGLLFALARALHRMRLSISFAKVSTEGHRVIDVFYVTEQDGSKLQPGPRADEVRKALIRAVDRTQPVGGQRGPSVAGGLSAPPPGE
ncbi:MAG: [protein-PII] uridylyltransferase [Myxococcales bacterium]